MLIFFLKFMNKQVYLIIYHRKVGPGGGNSDEGECIEVYDLEESKIRDFISNNTAPKTPGKFWFLIYFKIIFFNFILKF